MIKRADIGGRVSDSKEEGLWAEFDDDDCLTHIGYYEQGRPVADCWAIDIDTPANVVKAYRGFEISRPIDDPECEAWLRALVAKVVEFTPGEHRCSFCQKLVTNGADLVTGPGVSICDQCVELSLEILIEADLFSRRRMLRLLMKKRGTNKGSHTA